MRIVLTALAAALLLAVGAPAALAEDPTDRLGPLTQRVRHPVYLLHLQPSPGRATVREPGVVHIELQGDWSNVWEHWTLTRSFGMERIDFDMEVLRLGASARVGLPLGLEVGLEVPLLTMGGGVADASIQSWHDALSVDNGGRNRVDDFRFGYRISLPETLEWGVEKAPTMALGDITVDLKGRVLAPTRQRPGLAARLLLKLPTGSLKRGTGSGVPDIGVVMMAEHGWGPLNLYAQVGVLGLGRVPELAPLWRTSSFTWSFATELMITPIWSFVAQLQGHTAFLKKVAHPYLSRSPMGLMIGSRLQLGPVDLSFAMEQDILNGDPTADVSLVGSVGLQIERKKR